MKVLAAFDAHYRAAVLSSCVVGIMVDSSPGWVIPVHASVDVAHAHWVAQLRPRPLSGVPTGQGRLGMVHIELAVPAR